MEPRIPVALGSPRGGPLPLGALPARLEASRTRPRSPRLVLPLPQAPEAPGLTSRCGGQLVQQGGRRVPPGSSAGRGGDLPPGWTRPSPGRAAASARFREQSGGGRPGPGAGTHLLRRRRRARCLPAPLLFTEQPEGPLSPESLLRLLARLRRTLSFLKLQA